MRDSASITTAALTCEGSCQATVMPGRTPASVNHPAAADASSGDLRHGERLAVDVAQQRTIRSAGGALIQQPGDGASRHRVSPVPTRRQPTRGPGVKRDRQFAHGVHLAGVLEQFRLAGQLEVGQPLRVPG